MNLGFFQITLLDKKIIKQTDNYSDGNHVLWIAGRTTDLALLNETYPDTENLFSIDCKEEQLIKSLLDLQDSKGVQIDKKILTGNLFFIFKAAKN